MPGRRRDNPPVDTALCRRCQINDPTITVRAEPLCTSCFLRYISTKVVKRMEAFRVRGAAPETRRTLLLPLSFGPCSLALLHTLHGHLENQTQKVGRPGYSLHVVYIHISQHSAITASMEKLKNIYPGHLYSTYSLLDQDFVQSPAFSHLFPPDADRSSLDTLFSALPSQTSRADVLQILLRKRINHIAAQTASEAILWAHSTTRLAESTLAETAKGRGASLTYMTTDSAPASGTSSTPNAEPPLPSYYPMRDILRKEILSFTKLVDPPLDDLVPDYEKEEATRKRSTTATKNSTIDDLTRQYFESVEKDYPSIVANVVRTTGKLKPRELLQAETMCELCDMPLGTTSAPERSRLCYGCIRTLGREQPAEVGI